MGDRYSNGQGSSLMFNNRITVDTSPPFVVDVTSTASDGTYGVGSEIPVLVTFNAPVVYFGQLEPRG
jgi:hypothetical protein